MRAPKRLSVRSKAIWRDINKKYKLEKYHYTLLEVGLDAFDRLIEAKKAVDEHGILLRTKWDTLIKNPATIVEKETRNGFLAAWKHLGIEMEPPQEVGRPTDSRELKWGEMVNRKKA
jgi:P27 family predicted phage terminase small subunit